MMPATCTMAGMCQGTPDVCKTPAPPSPSPVPIPYPNLAQVPMTQSASMKVLIMNKETVCENNTIPRTNGDEAGVAGGVTSGVFGDQMAFKLGSSKVKAEGKKVCMVTSLTAHNGSNANMPAGQQVVPSQVKVLVAL